MHVVALRPRRSSGFMSVLVGSVRRERPTVALISKAMTMVVTHGKARLLGGSCRLVLITPESWLSYSPEPSATATNFEWVRIPTILTGHNHLHVYRGLGGTLARLKPDLVHIDEEPWSLVTWQALRHARRLHTPALAFTWQNIDKRYPPPFGAIERYTYRHAELLIAGTEEAAQLLRKRGFRGPIRVIPQFGVDLELFAPRPSTKAQFGFPAGGFVVGYVGRLVPEKGVGTVIQALPELPDVHFAVAGVGPEEMSLRRLAARTRVADRVHFVGGLPSTRVPEIMAAFDALVLPSRTTSRWKEQFGRVLVEAMAMRVPVIGSSSAEIPRVIGDAGLVFAEGDPRSLARAVRAVQDPVLREAVGERAVRRVRAHFSQERISHLTLEAWREVLRGA